MTRECLEKREMVFYMFLCVSIHLKKIRKEIEGDKEKKRLKNYGMRVGSVRVSFFRVEDKKYIHIQPKKRKTKESRGGGKKNWVEDGEVGWKMRNLQNSRGWIKDHKPSNILSFLSHPFHVASPLLSSALLLNTCIMRNKKDRKIDTNKFKTSFL